MFLKRVIYGVSSVLLSLSSLVVLMSPAAHAASMTWTGGGGSGDTNMTSAANWGGTAPVAGDDLIFPISVTSATIVNDFPAATSFNSILFSGVSGSAYYTISGASMTIVQGITNSSNNAATLSTPLILNSAQTISNISYLIFDGVVSGSGNLIKTGVGGLLLSQVNSFSGSLTINGGLVSANADSGLGQTGGATIVNNGGGLSLEGYSGTTATITEPITLNGTSYNNGGILSSFFGGGGGLSVAGTLTMTGPITLGAAAEFYSDRSGSIINITGALSGNYVASVYPGSQVQLNVNSSSNTSGTANGTYRAPVQETTYSANSPSTSIYAGYNQTAIVTGTYGYTGINNNGILKGTGTVGSLSVYTGGTVAPGMSPGILNTGNLYIYGGTYQAEIGGTGASEYDQLNVTGTVDLGAGVATLSTAQFNNFIPTVGNSFTIINNDAADAVVGTFAGLAQGATVTSTNGVEYTISYVGGDGNDVVLTASVVPAVPNTGAQLIKNNPIVTLIITVIAAGGIALIARKKFAINKK